MVGPYYLICKYLLCDKIILQIDFIKWSDFTKETLAKSLQHLVQFCSQTLNQLIDVIQRIFVAIKQPSCTDY